MTWIFSKAMVKDYVNSLSSQEQAAAFSEAICLDGGQFAQLNVTPTQHKFWRNDKTMESCDLSQFGLTLQHLTVAHGVELLMSYLAAFPARTSAPPVTEPGLMVPGAGCGHTWQGSFARYSPDESKWKTVQCSLLGDLESFSETWPRWGSMRNGASFLRPTPALPICESASGLWQTPVADDAIARKDGKWNSRGEPKLSAEVKIWPTPNAMPASNDLKLKCSGDGRIKPNKLGWAVSESGADGLLNPEWVEWLMGWPAGWTDLKPLEMDKFREWQQQHGRFSANETI